MEINFMQIIDELGESLIDVEMFFSCLKMSKSKKTKKNHSISPILHTVRRVTPQVFEGFHLISSQLDEIWPPLNQTPALRHLFVHIRGTHLQVSLRAGDLQHPAHPPHGSLGVADKVCVVYLYDIEVQLFNDLHHAMHLCV